MYFSLALIGDNSGYSKSDVQTLNMYSTVNIIVEKISNLLKIIRRDFDMSNVLATTVIRVRKINITIVMFIILLRGVFPDSIISKAFAFTFLYKKSPHIETNILWEYYIILLPNMQLIMASSKEDTLIF